MKRFLQVIVILIAFVAILIGLFFFTKIRIKDKLDSRVNLVKVEWDGLAQLQNQNHSFLRQLIASHPDMNKSNDSLISLLNDFTGQRNLRCNDTILAQQYELNKSVLALMQQITENNDTLVNDEDSISIKFDENLNELNRSVKQYNAEVRAFNLYYSTFPVFLFGKFFDIKRQVYFDLTYGIVNPDPIAKKNEIPAWQRKIEEEHGFTE